MLNLVALAYKTQDKAFTKLVAAANADFYKIASKLLVITGLAPQMPH
jgi:hypothetical protein